MRVLVINCGSSSLKHELFDMADGRVLARGLVERIAEPLGHLSLTFFEGRDEPETIERDEALPDHKAALERVLALLADPEKGVVRSAEDITAVGHRIVHGGERFFAPALIDDKVIEDIRANIPLAPLHNPANLTGVETLRAMAPDMPQVAVFDTAFHQSMPPLAYHYALPKILYEKHKLRRYGFHGPSHRYVSRLAAAFLGKPLAETKLVTLHLGNGASAAAILGGRSIDTSMGMTPLSGLIMGNRCGDIDPEIVLYLAQSVGLPCGEIDRLLNHESGLKGLAGVNDMRDIHARADAGDADAKLAFEAFCYAIRKYVGGYHVALGGLDALIFTAGIGEHDPRVRAEVCMGLACLGVELDPAANLAPTDGPRAISKPASAVAVLVIPTDEELEIATQTVEALRAAGGHGGQSDPARRPTPGSPHGQAG